MAAGSAAGAVVCAAVWPGLFGGMGAALAADAGPSMQFPTAARERIAVASYPFRDHILGRSETGASVGTALGKMELKEFAAHVSANFNIKKIEPWSEHFRSLDKAYLEELRAAVAQAGGAIANNTGHREPSPYPADPPAHHAAT